MEPDQEEITAAAASATGPFHMDMENADHTENTTAAGASVTGPFLMDVENPDHTENSTAAVSGTVAAATAVTSVIGSIESNSPQKQVVIKDPKTQDLNCHVSMTFGCHEAIRAFCHKKCWFVFDKYTMATIQLETMSFMSEGFKILDDNNLYLELGVALTWCLREDCNYLSRKKLIKKLHVYCVPENRLFVNESVDLKFEKLPYPYDKKE